MIASYHTGVVFEDDILFKKPEFSTVSASSVFHSATLRSQTLTLRKSFWICSKMFLLLKERKIM